LNPKLETRKAATVAYIKHRGPYDAVPWEDYIKRLYGWAKDQKVMPGFYPMMICYDNPENARPEELRSDIAITFKGRAKKQGGVMTRKLPAMKVATVSHKGPSDKFRDTYAKLSEWIELKGYVISGPSIEVYSRKPEIVRGVRILYAKIMLQVKKK